MKFSYQWLRELVPSLPPPRETATLLTMHAFEVSDLRRTAGDWVLDVDILPNRMADASSHLGVARELAAILAVARKSRRLIRPSLPKRVVREDRRLLASACLSVRIEDAEGCSFYAGRVIEGLRVRSSPPWLARRLRVLGLEPINAVVDATNYVMLETGQPLHAFDLDCIAQASRASSGGGESAALGRKLLVVRRARAGERMTTLDGEERTLDPSITVIADREQPLAIAGIKGGTSAAITSRTTRIALEAAHFDAQRIYRASRKLGIATDASRRFEAGRSPLGVVEALDRVASLIVELSGGRIAAGVVTGGTVRDDSRAIPFSPARCRSMLGIPMDDRDAKRALEAIGCTILTHVGQLTTANRRRTTSGAGRHRFGVGEEGSWTVMPPPDRPDLVFEEDLIEEVGRLIGYHIIERDLPHALLIPATVPPRHEWADRARDILVGHGFSETMRLSLVNEALLRDWGFDVHDESLVALENPQSAEATIFRPTMLPRLLSQAEIARRREVSVRLFEIGAVALRDTRGGVSETTSLGIVIATEAVAHPTNRAAFFEVKGVVQDLCERFGLTDIAWVPLTDAPPPWHPGRCAALSVDGKGVGTVGEFRPRILRAHPSLGVVAAAELHLDLLADAATEEHEYRPPSKFPEVIRDLSVLVPKDVLADAVGEEISRVGKSLVRDIDLFDYYEGEEIPEGMKSLAFHIVYQSHERTLTAAEVDAVHRAIEGALRRRGWEVR